jgi:hypothetical protein
MRMQGMAKSVDLGKTRMHDATIEQQDGGGDDQCRQRPLLPDGLVGRDVLLRHRSLVAAADGIQCALRQVMEIPTNVLSSFFIVIDFLFMFDNSFYLKYVKL